MRILVISHNCFSKVYNNGQTLESLFYCQPKEDLSQLFFHPDSYPDFDFCDNLWQITENDLIKSVLTRSDHVGHCINKSPQNAKMGYPKIFIWLKKLCGNVLRELLWSSCCWESPALWTWLNNFRPQLVFYVGGPVQFSADIALEISSRFHIPLAVYYTDDYLFSIDTSSHKGRRKYQQIKKLYSMVLEHSSAQFAIGDMMALEYENYFNKPFIPILNSIKIRPYVEYIDNPSISIAYFGGLHLARWNMIVRLAKLLDNKAKIVVYTDRSNIKDEIQSAFEKVGVACHDLLSGSCLIDAMNKSDMLLHVESNDVINRRFTRLAISTKIPEYLISGRPILGFGPVEVASMKLLSENDIGYIVNSEDSDAEIRNNILTIINDYSRRKELGLKGYYYAVRRFDVEIVSKKLLQELSSII